MYGMLNSLAQCQTLAGYIFNNKKNKDLLVYISYTVPWSTIMNKHKIPLTVKKNLTYKYRHLYF